MCDINLSTKTINPSKNDGFILYEIINIVIQ